MAKWSRAYKNRLPDAAFLYIEPGGRKDAGGRTVPRSLRHLPVYDIQGRLSPSHLRSVLGSYGQRAEIPAHAKAEARAMARELLGASPASRRRAPARVVSITRVPKVTPGAHVCHHCKKTIQGHPLTFWSEEHPPRHYHPAHAKHRFAPFRHRRAA